MLLGGCWSGDLSWRRIRGVNHKGPAVYPCPRDMDGYGLMSTRVAQKQSSSAPQIAKALVEMYAAAPPSDVTACI